MKKIFTILIAYCFLFVNTVFAAPSVKNFGLPSKGGGKGFFVSVIDEFIAVIIALAVFALIFSGIFYLISAGNEEKVGKAKKWVIWSLVGVFISSLSWGIVNFLNNQTISL